MSMYYAAYFGHGLRLNNEEFDQFLNAYGAANNLDIRKTLNEETPLREYTFQWSNQDYTFDITPIYTDDCDGMRLLPIVKPDGSANQPVTIEYDLRAEDSYLIFADRSIEGPHAFNANTLEYKGYRSYSELKQEMIDKLQNYVPDNFDWDSHIGLFSYAAYA